MVEFKQTVEVWSKNNVKLAVFSKPNDVNTPETAKELMLDPYVEMEQNGSSTLEFSINKNSEKWKIIQDPENKYVADGREYSPLQENAYTFEGDYVSVVAVESWYELDKKYVQAYNVDPSLEGIDEHTVVLLPKSTHPLYINGVLREDNPYPRGSAGYNMWAVLQGSGWNLGICDVMVDGFSPEEDFGVFNIETDMKSVLENIKQIQKLYGGILVWHSLEHTVDLRDEDKWNTDLGFEARVGKNLEEEPEIIQSNDIITRLYPLGQDYLNIKAVNDGLTYVENYSWTDTTYSRIVQNSDIFDQKQLKFWGEEQLKKMCKPTRSTTIKLIDRRLEPGYETDEFELNSIVTIYYTNPDGEQETEKQRIIKWRYNVFNPSDSEIECGNKSRNIVEILKQSFDMGEIASGKFTSNGTISSGTVYVPDYYGGSYGWGGGSLSNYLNQSEQQLQIMVEYIDDTTHTLAGFMLYADETYATIEALAAFENETVENLARLRLYADENFATVESFASYRNKTDGDINGLRESNASLKLYADSINATAQLVTSVVNSDGSIKRASIVQSVNASGSSIKISADHIDLEGVTRFVNTNNPNGSGSLRWATSSMLQLDVSGGFFYISGGYLSVGGRILTTGGIQASGGNIAITGSGYAFSTTGGTGQTTSVSVSSGLTTKTLKFSGGILVGVS